MMEKKKQKEMKEKKGREKRKGNPNITKYPITCKASNKSKQLIGGRGFSTGSAQEAKCAAFWSAESTVGQMGRSPSSPPSPIGRPRLEEIEGFKCLALCKYREIFFLFFLFIYANYINFHQPVSVSLLLCLSVALSCKVCLK